MTASLLRSWAPHQTPQRPGAHAIRARHTSRLAASFAIVPLMFERGLLVALCGRAPACPTDARERRDERASRNSRSGREEDRGVIRQDQNLRRQDRPIPISAGKQLVELKARIDGGEDGEGVNWWKWYAERFKNRTRRDAQKVMALARSDDPEAAAEEEREKNREAQANKRERDKELQPGATSDSQTWTEEGYAAQIVRDVEDEVANLQDQVADPDLLRELILQKLTFAFKGDSAEEHRALEEAPAKKRGRPAGSKNKSKDGNGVDTDASAEAMKKKFDEPPATEPDLTIPESMRRYPEKGAAV